MPDRQWFPRGITVRGPTLIDGPGAIATSSGITITDTLTLSSGIDWPISTGPSTGTDLIIGNVHVLVTSSDGGYYRIDPPATVGMDISIVRNGTTATTSYFIPDTTGVLIYTSSGSSGGRLGTLSGGAGFSLLALTTAQWIPVRQWGNVAFTSST